MREGGLAAGRARKLIRIKAPDRGPVYDTDWWISSRIPTPGPDGPGPPMGGTTAMATGLMKRIGLTAALAVFCLTAAGAARPQTDPVAGPLARELERAG